MQTATAQQAQSATAVPQTPVTSQQATATTSPMATSATSEVAASTPSASLPSNALNAPISKEEKKVPLMHKNSIRLSIKHPRKDMQQQAASTQDMPQVVTQPQEDLKFDEKELSYYWQEYAGRLPLEHKAIAMRMQNIRPKLLDETNFEVVVDNEITAKDFIAFIPEMQTYLRDQLKNRKIKMTVRVSEATENVRAFSRVEKFQMMAQKNSTLLQLKEAFGLEFY